MTEPAGGADAVPGRREVREAAKRRRARRGVLVSAVSSVLVLGGLAAFIVTRPGWENVKATFFDWDAFKEAFPGVLDGFWIDIKLFVAVEIVVLILGLVIALSRTSIVKFSIPTTPGTERMAARTDASNCATFTERDHMVWKFATPLS